MTNDPAPLRPPPPWSLRQFLLRRAFQILGFFTLLFLATCLPVSSRAPSPAALARARVAFSFGAATWIMTFLFCLQSFFIPAKRPSFIASFTFFLFLGVELLMVAAVAFG